MPANGQAVAILRRNVVAILALANAGIEKVADLAGHSIGVVGFTLQDQKALGAILAQYEVPPDRVRIVPIELNEIADALRDGKFEALLVAGTVTGRSMSSAVAAMTRDGQPPKFVPVSELEVIAQRLPAYELTEIVAGAFGGVPPRPAANVETIGFSHYLVARSSLEENIVGEFTRLLFGMRQTLAPEFPNIGRIEAPSTDKDADVAVHPGRQPISTERRRTSSSVIAMSSTLASCCSPLWDRRSQDLPATAIAVAVRIKKTCSISSWTC